MHTLELIVTGRTAVAGEVTGTARIILTHEDSHLVQQGDILITPMTDPDMVPAMQQAAAVVTDRGGMLCHAAIICREMGKPCIVGTNTASTAIANASKILVSAPFNRRGAVHNVIE
jgi:pyruvate,water dikinase